MTKKLSVIIVTYKSLEVITGCLGSIARYNDLGDELEVIIVDNSPPEDPMFDLIKEKYTWLTIIKNHKNGGFGQGNNVGANHAAGDYLLFLNPDTILVENIFRFAYNKFQENPLIAAFGIKNLSFVFRPLDSFFYRNEYYGFFRYLSIKLLNSLNLFKPQKMFTTGACLFVRKQVFLEAGMFDENIFMYLEEPDLFNRIDALKKGYTFAFFPGKKLIHLDGEQKSSPERHKQYYKSVFYYFQKYNLSVNHYRRFMLKYLSFKRFVYKFCGRKDGVREMDLHLSILAQISAETENHQ